MNDGSGYLPTWRYPTVEYLRALLASGWRVRDVQDPLRPGPTVDPAEPAPEAAKRDDPAPIARDLEVADRT